MGRSLWLCLLICILLQCPFSFSWKNLTFLDLSSNLLEGPLPSSICNLKNLQYLLLSDNKLNGAIPHCFGNISQQIIVLDLQKNGFHGMIPPTFPEGNQLKSLRLNGNQLEGALPRSLINCKSLEVLDVGHNKVSDAFPTWLETLSKLRVLILKSNRFHGTMETSMTKSAFQNLRIWDISYNQFTGHLPADMIQSFHAMKRNDSQTQPEYKGNDGYYFDSVTVTVTWKGLERDFVITRVLTTFTVIDISGNQFEGKIPRFIGDLNSLKVLNFSNNKFNGLIPSTLGDLAELESLDLSCNQLEGRIPPELRKLNFLSILNLSQNHLVGPIPQGGQFNTFNISSFSGNSKLCGFPLKDCGEVEGSQSPTQWTYHHTDILDLESGCTWKPVVLGYCFGMILGLLIGALMFSTRTPKGFVDMVEDMCKTSIRSRKESLRWLKK